MHTINIPVDNIEYDRLKKRKGARTWREYILQQQDHSALKERVLAMQLETPAAIIDAVLDSI